jgi:hypothetical protein
MTKDDMHHAYRVADALMKDRLREKAPELLKEIESLEEADVLVTVGEYDHIQEVLKIAGTPYKLIGPAQLAEARLRADQILFVNCAGHFGPGELRKVRTFVEQGGFLFTTDWALKHVLQPAFPGFVEFNERPTGDEVVRVEILDRDDPFLASLMGPDDDPQWWLEGSSYPIRILDPEKVKVILTSKELGEKYGEPAVFITFEVGLGRVYHMISHFYLQRTETRSKRHSFSSEEYLKEKGIPETAYAKYKGMGSDKLNLGEVESAFASHTVMSKVMYEKQQQMRRLQNDRNDVEKDREKKS